MKRFLAIILAGAMLLTFAACGNNNDTDNDTNNDSAVTGDNIGDTTEATTEYTGDPVSIDGEKAQAFIDEFFGYITMLDYAEANKYLHPERPASLPSYFAAIKDDLGISFYNGMTVDSKTVSTVKYGTDGSNEAYAATMSCTVDGVKLQIYVEVMEDQAGYGIYNLKITPESALEEQAETE